MAVNMDRRIHARGSGTGPDQEDSIDLVRYDRAGKWYVEGCGLRRHVSFAAAVDIAETIVRNGGTVFFGLPGGGRFDQRLEDYR